MFRTATDTLRTGDAPGDNVLRPLLSDADLEGLNFAPDGDRESPALLTLRLNPSSAVFKSSPKDVPGPNRTLCMDALPLVGENPAEAC
jgi:hypothetical protein